MVCGLVFLLLAMMFAPSTQQKMTNIRKGKLSIEETAYYDITFVNNWSATNHPVAYPSNAHWSPPVCVSHVKSYQLWRKGKRASEGVKIVAETGGTFKVSSTLRDLQSQRKGPVLEFAVGSAIFGDESVVARRLKVTKRYRFISLISMIAPSPDWFAGFNSIAPFENEKWHNSFRVELFPFDAGTDSGTTYTAADSPIVPQEHIFRFTAGNAPGGIFVKDKKIAPVAYIDFRRVR